LFLVLPFIGWQAPADAATDLGDEEILRSAGLSTEGPALLAFFQARARADVDPDRLRVLLRRFASPSNQERSLATAEFLGLGPLSVPTLRRAANDLNDRDTARRAAACLRWLEGPNAAALPAAAARVLASRKPEGAAEALLAYLPAADDADVLRATTTALAAVAAPGGKPDPALVRGLGDPLAVRRAAAGVALARANPPERVPEVRKLLKDPAPGVRLRAALALAEAHDAEAVPALIELLAELPPEQRKRVEEFLTQLAGEWAPAANFAGEDEIARNIRRDAWAAWWRNVDGAALLTAVRKRTLTTEDRKRIKELLTKLSSEDFSTREGGTRELFEMGRRSLPQLKEAAKSKDAETASRAKQLIERIEQSPEHHLPAAALRLLALRKPPGAVEALLAYLPNAEDDDLSTETLKSLTALALRDDKLDPALLRALDDPKPEMRAVAAEALAKGGGDAGRAEARKRLKDTAPTVRLRAAMALATMKEREGVPVLIDLLTVLPSEQVGQVEDALYQLAGDTAPEVSLGEKADEKKKCRDAWLAWWKVNAARVDLGRLTARPWYGYTLICDCGRNRVYEIDRNNKERWAIDNVQGPFDAWVLPRERVLIAEFNANRVTERDFKGNIIWQKQVPGNPSNVQRLANGNTLIAMNGGAIMEVDRTGKEVYTIPNVPGNTLAAYRARNGDIYCMTFGGQCLVLDTTGKQLATMTTGHDANSMGGIDLLPNGRVLISNQQGGKVYEFDREGKKQLELDAPGIRTASTLPNGHILVASQNNQRVYELDRAGKTVWEYKDPGNPFRARRR
jgi:HEAT repeat protein